MTKDELRAEISALNEIINKLQSIRHECRHDWFRSDGAPNARFCAQCKAVEVYSGDGHWWRRDRPLETHS